jgi:hypothetical protein
MIIVFCRICWQVVSGKDIDPETAEWIRQDHEDEHYEIGEGDDGDQTRNWADYLQHRIGTTSIG